MFTSLATDKSGGVSGMASWFSSLRRQPKNKKPQDKKSLQKSCVDLTTNNIYYDVSPVRVPASPTKSHASDISIEDTATKCTCDITTTTNVETTRVKSQVRSSDCQKVPKISSNSATTTTETNSRSIYSVRNKEEFRTTTTTKITKTTVVNRQQTYRVGMIFDEDGELMNSNLDLWQLANRCKSRERLVFDVSGKRIPTTVNNNNNNNSHTLNNNNLSSSSNFLSSGHCDKPINLLNDESIEFIDCTNAGDDIYNTEKAAQATQCKNCKNKSRNFAKSKSETHLNHTNKQIKDELCEVVSEMEQHDAQEDSKHSNKDKQMTIGRKKFNMDPKKGIEYLYENHLLRTDPKDVAQFLYKGEGLNKTAIGDYLGEKNDFNEAVLKAFVELHDFTNLILVEALRQFLWSFRLPGEAQKIDRMMECFAQRYCHLNPDIFTNTDTCYVLSFAIIMLNTSLHNPSVKDKPTVEQFISMNRGINNGGDLPRELLESLYESIRTEPFKIPQDDGNDLMHTFFNPDKEGWLWKQGGRYKSWKRRWFILNDNCLYYFEYTTDKEPRGIIPLENISVREITDRNKPHCFELFACGGADIIKACKTDSEGKVVEGKHTVYRMSAATEEEKQEWIKCLQQSISHNPFYDILVQRKKKALAKS